MQEIKLKSFHLRTMCLTNRLYFRGDPLYEPGKSILTCANVGVDCLKFGQKWLMIIECPKQIRFDLD